jgi:hypothetical protein
MKKNFGEIAQSITAAIEKVASWHARGCAALAAKGSSSFGHVRGSTNHRPSAGSLGAGGRTGRVDLATLFRASTTAVNLFRGYPRGNLTRT